jgi:hypothetical protein
MKIYIEEPLLRSKPKVLATFKKRILAGALLGFGAILFVGFTYDAWKFAALVGVVVLAHTIILGDFFLDLLRGGF